MEPPVPDASTANAPDAEARRRWMRLLARATRDELESGWDTLTDKPRFTQLRKPEPGLVMVRGRAGGTGAPFNLGEMTVTRCAVRLETGAAPTGLSYIAGRDSRRAELAAMFDALLQDATRRAEVERTVLTGVTRRIAEDRQARTAEVAATRVDFFTLAREQSDE